jgi:hypothetical protein
MGEARSFSSGQYTPSPKLSISMSMVDRINDSFSPVKSASST